MKSCFAEKFIRALVKTVFVVGGVILMHLGPVKAENPFENDGLDDPNMHFSFEKTSEQIPRENLAQQVAKVTHYLINTIDENNRNVVEAQQHYLDVTLPNNPNDPEVINTANGIRELLPNNQSILDGQLPDSLPRQSKKTEDKLEIDVALGDKSTYVSFSAVTTEIENSHLDPEEFARDKWDSFYRTHTLSFGRSFNVGNFSSVYAEMVYADKEFEIRSIRDNVSVTKEESNPFTMQVGGSYFLGDGLDSKVAMSFYLQPQSFIYRREGEGTGQKNYKDRHLRSGVDLSFSQFIGRGRSNHFFAGYDLDSRSYQTDGNEVNKVKSIVPYIGIELYGLQSRYLADKAIDFSASYRKEVGNSSSGASPGITSYDEVELTPTIWLTDEGASRLSFSVPIKLVAIENFDRADVGLITRWELTGSRGQARPSSAFIEAKLHKSYWFGNIDEPDKAVFGVHVGAKW